MRYSDLIQNCYAVEKRTAYIKSNGEETWSKWHTVRLFARELNAFTKSIIWQKEADSKPVDQFKIEFRVVEI